MIGLKATWLAEVVIRLSRFLRATDMAVEHTDGRARRRWGR